MQEYNCSSMDGELELTQSLDVQKEWFTVEGDLDDFIFYDPTGYEWPRYSDL